MPGVKIDRILKGGIAVLLVLFLYVIQRSFRENVVKQGDSAPDFSITADNGRSVTLSNFGGRLLVLNFWATWCPPCLDELPSLDRFQRQLANSGVIVLGISVDQDAKAYKDFVDRVKPSFLTARDPERKINTEYGTTKFPETYVIGTNGKVLRKFIGPATWDDPRMLQDIRSLL